MKASGAGATASAWVEPSSDLPVVFAGRYSVGDGAATTITEALPRSLHGNPSHWVIADAVSLPYEQLTAQQWDAPMDVILPNDLGPDALIPLLDRPLFRRMTRHDAVVADEDTWRTLQRRYGWAESQWNPPEANLADTVHKLVAEAADTVRLDGSSPSLRSRSSKSRFAAESAVVVPMLREAMNHRPRGTTTAAADLSDTVGCYLPMLSGAAAEVTAIRTDPVLAAQAAFDHPHSTVLVVEPGSGAAIAAESLDVILLDVDLQDLTQPWRAGVLADLWRGLRVGGALVAVRRIDRPDALPLAGFSDVLLEATCGNIVLEDLASVRNPVTGRTDRAAMLYAKIGVPSRW